MVRIRAFENAAEDASKGGVAAFGANLGDAKVRGPLHLSTGQEAVAAGVCAHLFRTDLMTSTHRGHGHTIAKGASLATMMCAASIPAAIRLSTALIFSAAEKKVPSPVVPKRTRPWHPSASKLWQCSASGKTLTRKCLSTGVGTAA